MTNCSSIRFSEEAVNRAYPLESGTQTSDVITNDNFPFNATAAFALRERESEASYEQPGKFSFPSAQNIPTQTLNISIQPQNLLLERIRKCNPLFMKRLLQIPVRTKRAAIQKRFKNRELLTLAQVTVPDISQILGAGANPPATEYQLDATSFNQPQAQRISPNIYNMIDCHRGLDREEMSHQNELEVAFLVPPCSLDIFYELHKKPRDSRQHSAILTIPIQDRVASLVLSIPRTEAVAESGRQILPVIFNSEPPSV